MKKTSGKELDFVCTSVYYDVSCHTSYINSSLRDPAIFTRIVPREPLSQRVAADIEEAIRSRSLLAGTKLPTEQGLCRQFGVSRTVVREAIRILSAKGLTAVVKGKGIFVRAASAETVTDPLRLYLQMSSTKDNVLDVIRARQMIEPVIAAEAALRRTEEDLVRLRKDIENLAACEAEYPELAHLDLAFHQDIARASQNRIMPLLINPIHCLMPEIKRSIYSTVRGAKMTAVKWHVKVLTMIERKDADGARAAMVEHLSIAERHARRMLKAQKKA